MLTSEDIELIFDLPENIEENMLHKNAIKMTNLKDFIDEIKSGKEELTFEIIDEIEEEGSIRIIGETAENIYYKKKYYDFALREKGDFLSLRQIGSYQVHKINKKTLEKTFIRNVHGDIEVKTNLNRAYTVTPQNKAIKIQDFDTDETIYTYKKRYIGKAQEEVIEFANDEYLVIGLESTESLKTMRYMIVDAFTDEIIIIGSDVLLLQDYLFIV